MIIRKTDLKNLTTIGIGPEIKVYFPQNEEELFDSPSLKVIGNGSNLLVDESFDKKLICLKELDDIEITENLIYAESGVLLSTLIGICIRNGFKGISDLAGIPGSIGGLIYMNAGDIGKNNCLKKIRCFSKDKGIYDLTVTGDGFSYRSSPFSEKDVILGAFFEMESSDTDTVFSEVRKNINIKKDTQPIFSRTFGSVFKNPDSMPAWRLINECGLKGKEKGDAKISEKHCNFIVNKGNASFSDVMYLIELCREKIYNKFSIILEKEVVVIRGASR